MRRGSPVREYFKSIGKCAVCGRRKPAKGRVTCRPCLDRQAGYNAVRVLRLMEDTSFKADANPLLRLVGGG